MVSAYAVPSGGTSLRGGRPHLMAIRRPPRYQTTSSWVWLTGMLCLSMATVLWHGGLMTYLTPFLGRGPLAGALGPSVCAEALAACAFLVHCLSVVFLGAAGALILHRAWHPTSVWRGSESDPAWVRRLICLYDGWSRHPFAVACWGTCLAAMLAVSGEAYRLSGEAMRLSFAFEPAAGTVRFITPIAIFFWPAALLALTNIYAVKRHFLPEGSSLDELVKPRDVVDLMHPSDTASRTRPEREPAGRLPSCRQVRAPLAAILRFVQVRTAALRLRTAQIGHTDVQSQWLSQQALRGYRWGGNHRLSESNAWSLAIHATVIFGPLVVAFLTNQFACVTLYKPPDGELKDARLRRPVIIRFVPKPKLLVNQYTSIVVVDIPPEVMEVIDTEALEHPWTGPKTDGTSQKGIIGGGPGIGPTGLPGGVPGGAVPFTRLQHNGEDWDRNLSLQADLRVLQQFHSRTGGIPVARVSGSVSIRQLSYLAKDGAPPFVYVTGRRPFSVTLDEARILRTYLLERGGLMIGDSPGGSFSPSFRAMVRRALGDQARWVEIPADDELFRIPQCLEEGAPPLWHHDGYRPEGIKVGDRWVVFYHPGDMGDAWKDGHSGATPEAVDAAYDMGTDLIYYALWHCIQFRQGTR